MLFAVLALDWSSNMIVVSNAVAFLNTLGVVRSGPFWCGPLCFTLDWSALAFLVGLFFYSFVWSKLGCPACCARAGLVRQHDCNIISSCLSQYVGRGQGSAAGAAEDHMTCLYLLKGA